VPILERSFLTRTHQLWKLNASLGVVSASLLFIFGLLELAPDPKLGAIGVVAALAICVFSTIWLFSSVRCPVCTKRVLWHAARTQPSGRWLGDLLENPKCPNCGADPGSPRGGV
jgi:hypothetical protein